MPRLPFKQLKSLTVLTVSGIKLGSVQDITLETDGQMVVQYRVKPLLSQKEYLIGRDQIVRIDASSMIVDDAVAKTPMAKEEKRRGGISPEPVAMREEG